MVGERPSRPSRPAVPPRNRPADRGRPERMRAPERSRASSDDADYGRAPRRSPEPPRASRPVERQRPPARRPEWDEAPPRATRRPAPVADTGGSRLRGIVAVVGVFFVTLAGAAVDSFVGIGLGLITLVSLVGATCIATLVVRKRDVFSLVVAPPIVFVLVAGVNIALAPSAAFNLPTIATLLIRGFPTMAVATGAALVLALVRLAARR